MRLTPEQEAAYALGYGVSRADLKPEVQAEYDRLLAERRAGRSGQAAHDPPEFTPGFDPGKEARTYAWIMTLLTLLAVLAFVAFVVVMAVNTRYSFQTLRADLDRVRLPSGYRLVTVTRSRNCSGCWLIETWAWSGNGGRTVSAACADVYHAMTAAYPPRNYGSVDGNPRQDMPAGTACDYFTVKVGPGFTKVGIEVFVRPDKAPSAGGVVIQLIASSDCYDAVSQKPAC
jgi:hypothetical protein